MQILSLQIFYNETIWIKAIDKASVKILSLENCISCVIIFFPLTLYLDRKSLRFHKCNIKTSFSGYFVPDVF